MLGFSAATMNAYQNGSPSALEGEAEQTRDVPTADLATGLASRSSILRIRSAALAPISSVDVGIVDNIAN